MKRFFSTAMVLVMTTLTAQAQTPPTSAPLPPTAAEVRKVDLDAKKITLKHEAIKNLDMPPMSMVFQVKDAALLANVKTGDKVLVTVDQVNGAFTVMTLEMAKP
jgi:Cu(I)/Ag(I) efflux system protein CusF